MNRLTFHTCALATLALLSAVLTSCGGPNPSGDAELLGSGEQADVLVHAEWTKNATIYEVNVRQHTPEGTFNALLQDLPG